jgi:ABC-2 type transport system permease protein
MLSTVIAKELTEMRRDGRFRLLGIATALLLLTALIASVAHVREIEDTRRAAAAADVDNFTQQGARNPHAAAHFGQYAFRPMPLTAFLDPGVSDHAGKAIWLEAHRRNLPEFRAAEDFTEAGRFGRLSTAWVLQFLVPLLLIALSFGAIARERERGTLTLIASQGVPLGRLGFGKLVAVLAALGIVLVPGIVAVLAALGLTGATDPQPDTWVRVGLLGVAYALYFVAFVGIGVAVSALMHTSRNAFLVLAVFWVATALVVPRVASDLAAARHPTPSASEFWAGINAEIPSETSANEQARRRLAELRSNLERELLARYQVADVRELPVNFLGKLFQVLEAEGATIFARHYDALWSTYESQRLTERALGAISPLLPLRSVSMGLAGTDVYAQRHFSEAAESHRLAFIDELNRYQAERGAGVPFFVADASAWRDISTFSYTPPDVASVLHRHRAEFALLAAWALAGLLASYLATRRLRPV